MHTHILKFSQPKSLEELKSHVKILVESLYDISYQNDCLEHTFPVVVPLRLFLTKDHLMNQLCNMVAWKLKQPRIMVARLITGTIGAVARTQETKWMDRNVQDEDDITPEWIIANLNALSWTFVCQEHEKRGLGCSCAFCAAVHVSAGITPDRPDFNLKALHEELANVMDDDKEKCCHTILSEIEGRMGWVVQEVDWDPNENPFKDFGGRH